MSNKKETPVRWLIDEYHTSGDLTWTDFDHALQMESQKQQKYDEMLAMLEDIYSKYERDQHLLNVSPSKIQQLIKEVKEL